MKKIILSIILLLQCSIFYGQIECCNGENNLIQNGDFESISSNGAPLNTSNNIQIAHYWNPIWNIGSRADVYTWYNSGIGYHPLPHDGNYASCWIDNRVRDALYREGMQVKLADTNGPITISPNSGEYNMSFEIASLSGWGSSEIGVYGVYNPQGTIVSGPTSSHNPTNLDLFGANNTVLLGTIPAPNVTDGTKQEVVLTFSADSANFPTNGIDHIFITRSSTIMSGGHYVAFDNFCLYNREDSPNQSDIAFLETYQSIQQLPSQYGPIDVATYCFPSEIILDGSNTLNETAYQIQVMPIDLLSWTTDPVVFDTGELVGQVPNTLNITNSFPWSLNTVYRVHLMTRPCYNEDAIFFQIVNPPQINLPSTIAVCDGNFQEICGPIAPNGTTYTYQWTKPGHNPNETLLLSEEICFTPIQTGAYTLVVTDENGCTDSHTITITNTIPQPDLGTVDCDLAPFSNINILNQGFDNPDYTITWYHNNQVVQVGGETLQMTITEGEVTVVVASDGCEPVSDTISIYCCPKDLEIVMNCETGRLEVQNLPNNITIQTMFWDFDFQTLPNSNSTTFQPTQEGVYSFGIIFTFPNGEECHHFIHYEYSEAYCCELLGSQVAVSLANVNSYHTVPNTPYGSMEIPAMCGRITLDGSLSTCEDSYYISVAAFDPVSWTNDPAITPNPLYEGWTQGQATNNIDLTQAPFNLVFDNQTYYMIQFAVGPDWDVEYILFWYDCDTKREMVIAPNPTQGKFEVTMKHTKEAGAIDILDISGTTIFKGTLSGEIPKKVDISSAKPGIYFVRVTIGKEVYTKRIIKN
jgi:hypothetical protein